MIQLSTTGTFRRYIVFAAAVILVVVGVRLSRSSESSSDALNNRPMPPGLDLPRPIAARKSLYLEEMTWMEVRDAVQSGTETVIVATGGIEQSGPYLPLGKHNFILREVVEKIAGSLGKTLIAPIVPFTPEGTINPPNGHMLYSGTISLRESTFEALLTDICDSLRQHGFKRIILLGDSGDNQIGMERVAHTRNTAWGASPGSRVLYIPEFYDYRLIDTELAAQGFQEQPEGIHDSLAFTAELLTISPDFVRYDERRSAGRLQINGISLEPQEKFVALGRNIIQARVARTLEAIKKRTLLPAL